MTELCCRGYESLVLSEWRENWYRRVCVSVKFPNGFDAARMEPSCGLQEDRETLFYPGETVNFKWGRKRRSSETLHCSFFFSRHAGSCGIKHISPIWIFTVLEDGGGGSWRVMKYPVWTKRQRCAHQTNCRLKKQTMASGQRCSSDGPYS